MKNQKNVKNRFLAVTMGSILSMLAFPSATVTTAAITTTVASFALTTNAYADKAARQARKAERLREKYERIEDRKNARLDKISDKALEAKAKSQNGVIPLPDGSGDGSPGRF